jgi:hypothetical protein
MPSTDVSAIVGVGMHVGRLGVLARYEVGLTNIDYRHVENRAVVLLVTYRFRISG